MEWFFLGTHYSSALPKYVFAILKNKIFNHAIITATLFLSTPICFIAS